MHYSIYIFTLENIQKIEIKIEESKKSEILILSSHISMNHLVHPWGGVTGNSPWRPLLLIEDSWGIFNI